MPSVSKVSAFMNQNLLEKPKFPLHLIIMKGKFAPGLAGPNGCDTLCNARLCPEETFEKTYSYLPSSRRQRGSRGVLMGYQSGFFAGWDASAFFLVCMQLSAFWLSAIMVKHLSAVYKNVGQGGSTLAVYYIGDLFLNYDPQNEKTNTTRLPCVLASAIIMLSIVLFATTDADKTMAKKSEQDQKQVRDVEMPLALADGDASTKLNDASMTNKNFNRRNSRSPTKPEPEGIEFAVISSSSGVDNEKV